MCGENVLRVGIIPYGEGRLISCNRLSRYIHEPDGLNIFEFKHTKWFKSEGIKDNQLARLREV